MLHLYGSDVFGPRGFEYDINYLFETSRAQIIPYSAADFYLDFSAQLSSHFPLGF